MEKIIDLFGKELNIGDNVITSHTASTNVSYLEVGEIIDMGVELGIVQKSGSWFSYNGDKLGQGRDAVKQLMLDNPELANEIETKIRTKLTEIQTGAVPAVAEEA